MGHLLRSSLVALLVAVSATAAQAQDGNSLVRARLTTELGVVPPGHEATLAVVLEVSPGWHVYWKNPGDSGMATKVTLTLTPGLAAGAVRWPAPTRFVHDGIVTYGYEGEVTLLVPLRSARALAVGEGLTLKARVSWLVCTAEACLPGRADVAVTLLVANEPAAHLPTPDAARVARATALVPQPAPAEFAYEWSTIDGALRLALRLPGATHLEFYPWQPEEVGPRDMATRGAVDGDALELLYPPTFLGGVAGVLAVTQAGATRFFDVVIPDPRE